jgi:phage tail-like protein
MALTHDAEHLGSQFALELDGVEVARFTGCSGLGATIQVVEHQTVSPDGRIHVLKRPGRVSYDDITLKRGLSDDKALTDWFQTILDGKVSDSRKNGSIVIYDYTGTETDRWNFEHAWPSKWMASDLDAGTDDIVIEEMTISHELLKRA